MNQNEQIVFDFYSAFQNLDAKKMTSFYSENIQFEDPAFGALKGQDAKNMWLMLCENATDLSITFQIKNAYQNKVYASWEAHYTFSKTGRKVINKIEAEFTIQNQLIAQHTDTFNLWLWSKQAMGITGWLIGWSGFFRHKLHKTTDGLLHKYSSNQG